MDDNVKETTVGRQERPDGRPTELRDLAKFTGAVALLAIFADAAIGHGLLWENDPYWTYWITKTFLIATIFALGTAWLGIGVGRGAIITAIHTVVLTVYYWSLSPIGLPSSPEWLDLEHTWVTGVPVHFGVIYLGYLLALWLWRRTDATPAEEDAAATATAALVASLAIVVVGGGLVSLALADFPGVTWYLVRLLITLPFILMWWAFAGHTTWWGVGLHHWHHGRSGIGSDELPPIHSEVAVFGVGEVSVDGEPIATAVPVHVMTAEEGLPGRLELDVGDPASDVPGLPDGHLRVMWADYEGGAGQDPKRARNALGSAVLVGLLALMLLLAREPDVSLRPSIAK